MRYASLWLIGAALLSGCATFGVGVATWATNVSVTILAGSENAKLIAGKTLMTLDGASMGGWMKSDNPITVSVPAARDHVFGVQAEIVDPKYVFGKEPLVLTWTGTAALKTEGKKQSETTAATATLAPETGAQGKKRDYITQALDRVPVLVSKDEILAAWSIVDGAATAAKGDGFQDLSERAETAKQNLQPAYEATIRQQKALARVLQKASLSFGTTDEPIYFVTFRDRQFSEFYVRDDGGLMSGRPSRRVKFEILQGSITPTPAGGAIFVQAMKTIGSDLVIQEFLNGVLDPKTGEFTGELKEQNSRAGKENAYEVHGKLSTQ